MSASFAYCPVCDRVIHFDPGNILTFSETGEPITHLFSDALVPCESERAARMYKASQQNAAEVAGQVKAL